METVEETLEERGARYGVFFEHATLAQAILDIMRETPGWHQMAPDQRQVIGMFADKMARIGNGDPHYPDNWRDIAGYATLVLRRLEKEADAIPADAGELPALLHKSAAPSTESS